MSSLSKGGVRSHRHYPGITHAPDTASFFMDCCEHLDLANCSLRPAAAQRLVQGHGIGELLQPGINQALLGTVQ